MGKLFKRGGGSYRCKWCGCKNDSKEDGDLAYPRVRIRQVILPEMLKINPGFPKVIGKMYREE